jgi:hypothetical protein
MLALNGAPDQATRALNESELVREAALQQPVYLDYLSEDGACAAATSVCRRFGKHSQEGKWGRRT